MEKVPIEELTNEYEIFARIKEENNKFNLEQFYKNDTEYYAAVGVITPKQTIFHPVTGMHQQVIEKIYQQLYGQFFDYSSFAEMFNNWMNDALKKGNIIIKLCSEVPSLIYFPDTISPRQYKELEKFIQDIKTINEKLNRRNKVEFVTNLEGMKEKFIRGEEISTISEKAKELIDINKKPIADEKDITTKKEIGGQER